MLDKLIVFDTTVLSNFLISDSSAILKKKYAHRGAISWQVYDELSAGYKKEPGLQHVEGLLEKHCFRLIAMSTEEHSRYITLLDSLGKGESSCIAISQSQGSIVATDDKAVRRICGALNIACTGTIGILVALCKDSVIDVAKADQLLGSMIATGFYSPIRKISDLI